MIDASIPLKGLLINRNDELQKQQLLQMNDMRMQEARQQQERQGRLSSLLPGAVRGDQASIDELYAIDPEIAMRMDDRQREAAKSRVQDLTAAVRWAQSPEDWAQVQQHYGRQGVDLTPYRFEDRERAMLSLGKLGEYLESAPKMDIRATEPGGGLYGVDPRSGGVKVLVQPNDGGAPMGAPAAPPLPPGFVLEGGQSGSAPAGGFQQGF